MTNKKHSSSSCRWLKEHFKDKYVRQTHRKKLRSRAWFKINEIQGIENFFKPDITVIDLGSSPGGWSQYVATKIGNNGRIIACDILPMNPIHGVDFIQGDFRDEMVLETLLKKVGNSEVQIIMSDMSPNISGISIVDISSTLYIVESVIEMCRSILTFNGNFLVKMFYGNGFEECLKKINSLFKRVKIRKLISSHTNSREVYVVATGRK